MTLLASHGADYRYEQVPFASGLTCHYLSKRFRSIKVSSVILWVIIKVQHCSVRYQACQQLSVYRSGLITCVESSIAPSFKPSPIRTQCAREASPRCALAN